MLAENTINIPMKDDDDIIEEESDIEDDSMDTTDESNDAVSTMEKGDVKREQQNESETSMSSFLSLGEFANR